MCEEEDSVLFQDAKEEPQEVCNHIVTIDGDMVEKPSLIPHEIDLRIEDDGSEQHFEITGITLLYPDGHLVKFIPEEKMK